LIASAVAGLLRILSLLQPEVAADPRCRRHDVIALMIGASVLWRVGAKATTTARFANRTNTVARRRADPVARRRHEKAGKPKDSYAEQG